MPIVIKVPKQEMYDEVKEEFITVDKDWELVIEHSLVSISKWESKWHRPFPYINTNAEKMTLEESLDYIRCMTINKDVPMVVYNCLSNDDTYKISSYINDPMSATTINIRSRDTGKKEILTSELLYYYIFKLGIPKECEKWHINRLMKLLEIYGIKDGSETNKMSRSELIARNRAINERNKAKFHSKG